MAGKPDKRRRIMREQGIELIEWYRSPRTMKQKARELGICENSMTTLMEELLAPSVNPKRHPVTLQIQDHLRECVTLGAQIQQIPLLRLQEAEPCVHRVAAGAAT